MFGPTLAHSYADVRARHAGAPGIQTLRALQVYSSHRLFISGYFVAS